jgi:hypothetical protein
MPSYQMLLLIFMKVEMILFENSALKMYLLNTHLNFHIYSFNFLIKCLFASENSLSKVYDKRNNT